MTTPMQNVIIKLRDGEVETSQKLSNIEVTLQEQILLGDLKTS